MVTVCRSMENMSTELTATDVDMNRKTTLNGTVSGCATMSRSSAQPLSVELFIALYKCRWVILFLAQTHLTALLKCLKRVATVIRVTWIWHRQCHSLSASLCAGIGTYKASYAQGN